MRIILVLISTLLSAAVVAQPKTLPFNGRDAQPAIFGEGIISTGDYESHPAFSPTGDTLYFVKSGPDVSKWTICVSYYRSNTWTKPVIASFSGQYMDADPFFTPDGKTLYFISNRPHKTGDAPKPDMDIWVMHKKGNAWTEPAPLPAPINSDKSEYYPTLTSAGTLYFGSRREGGKGNSDIYRSELINGQYQTAVNLGDAINGPGSEYEPFIFPDESVLIFLVANPDHLDNADLYISYQRNNQWTQAERLPEPINSGVTEFSPKLSFNGKYFFFASSRNRNASVSAKKENEQEMDARLHRAGNGLSDIYWVDVEALRIKK